VIDFTCVVEIMGDHDAKDVARRQFVAPICEPLLVEFKIVCKFLHGIKSVIVSLWGRELAPLERINGGWSSRREADPKA
jgi:hypothetical protein